jgi:hypothetical protein
VTHFHLCTSSDLDTSTVSVDAAPFRALYLHETLVNVSGLLSQVQDYNHWGSCKVGPLAETARE